jgi:hypothetical protein
LVVLRQQQQQQEEEEEELVLGVAMQRLQMLGVQG